MKLPQIPKYSRPDLRSFDIGLDTSLVLIVQQPEILKNSRWLTCSTSPKAPAFQISKKCTLPIWNLLWTRCCAVFSCILETNVGNWASDKLLEFVEISILFYTLEVSRQVESLGLDL